MFQAQPRALFYTIVSHSRTSFNGGQAPAGIFRCSFLFGASVLPRLIFLPNRYFFRRASARRHLRDDSLSQALLLSRAPIFLKSQTYIALCCPLLLSLTLRRHCLMLYIEIQGGICYNIFTNIFSPYCYSCVFFGAVHSGCTRL